MTTLALEPVLGWRLWHVRDGRLESWTRGHEWPARERLEARCRHDDAPGRTHRCGIYAFRERRLAEELLRRWAPASLAGCRPVALGSVSLWGRVVPHDDGWRGQFAYPYELFVFGGDDDLALELREGYAVDVMFANAG